jgi:heterodisulfide reductase subunit D
VDLARKHAEHNVADWRAVGARRIIAPDPHDYIAFTEDYPRLFGEDYEFEIVLGVELVNDLVKEGRIALTQRVQRTVTYHDPCRLNKRKGVHAAPRELLRAVPGIELHDVDHVTQWSYCSGGGGGLPVEKPEITAEISRRRVAKAQVLEVDTLISACPWSERPLSQAGAEAEEPLEVMDLFELVAQSAGIDVVPAPPALKPTSSAPGGGQGLRSRSRARSTTRSSRSSAPSWATTTACCPTCRRA